MVSIIIIHHQKQQVAQLSQRDRATP